MSDPLILTSRFDDVMEVSIELIGVFWNEGTIAGAVRPWSEVAVLLKAGGIQNRAVGPR